MPSANFKPPALKQKTLLGFFNKSTSSTTPLSKERTSEPATKGKDNITKALSPKIKSSDAEGGEDDRKYDPTSPVASSLKSYESRISDHAKDTPPTSDIIDIDMLSDLTDEEGGIVEKPVSSLIMYNGKIRDLTCLHVS